MNEAETLSEFFQYLDSLTKSDFDAKSLTGHGFDWLKKFRLAKEVSIG